MNISNSILEKESPQVREMFTFWAKRMHCEVDFWPLEDDIDVHTEGHCERVLLHALRLANMQKLRIRATIALCHAAIFHDTRRKDNYLDKGHGERAAEYYKAFCAEHADMHYLPEAYAAIRFHDQDDILGAMPIFRMRAKMKLLHGSRYIMISRMLTHLTVTD